MESPDAITSLCESLRRSTEQRSLRWVRKSVDVLSASIEPVADVLLQFWTSPQQITMTVRPSQNEIPTVRCVARGDYANERSVAEVAVDERAHHLEGSNAQLLGTSMRSLWTEASRMAGADTRTYSAYAKSSIVDLENFITLEVGWESAFELFYGLFSVEARLMGRTDSWIDRVVTNRSMGEFLIILHDSMRIDRRFFERLIQRYPAQYRRISALAEGYRADPLATRPRSAPQRPALLGEDGLGRRHGAGPAGEGRGAASR
jgi:hypothetical protein